MWRAPVTGTLAGRPGLSVEQCNELVTERKVMALAPQTEAKPSTRVMGLPGRAWLAARAELVRFGTME